MSARDDAERIVGRFKGYVVSGSSSEYEAVRVRLVRLVAAAIDLKNEDERSSRVYTAEEVAVMLDDCDRFGAAVGELVAAVAALTGEEHGDGDQG